MNLSRENWMEEPARGFNARERALELMSEALDLLDEAGRPLAAAHLAHAIDVLRSEGDSRRVPAQDP